MRLWRLSLFLMILPPVPAWGEPLPPAKWLVDLGRDYPLTPQAAMSNVDAQITLAFMQAASRIDPDLAEAYLWQYDMLSALGRDLEARNALGEYIRREPDDVAAHLKWINLATAGLQTAEARAKLFGEYLKSPNVPVAVAGELHRRLAEYYWNRGANAQAETEVQATLRDDPRNPAALRLLDDIRNAPQTPATRIKYLLAATQNNPADIGVAQQLGDELSSVGMPAEADRWYQHAIKMSELIPPGTPAATLLAARAEALLDMGKLGDANTLAHQAITRDSKSIQAHLILTRVAQKRKDTDTSKYAIAKATDLWKSMLLNAPGKLDTDTIAEMAWFFAHQGSQPAETETLARSAIADSEASLTAQRALGSALRQLNRQDEARAVLEPIADQDTWAAIELARSLHTAGQLDEAARRIGPLTTQPATSEQRDTINSLVREWRVPISATQPAVDEAKTMLAAFPAEVLNYPAHPDKYLSLSTNISAKELSPTDPWLCTVELRNIGSFPITFGEDAMVVPELLCAIETRGDRPRSSGPNIRILFNRQLQLKPGESMEVKQTILLAPIRGSMIGTPQVGHDVEVSALFSPMRLVSADGKEVWQPRPGGLLAKPLQFRRKGFVAPPQEVRNLVKQSQDGESKERIAATELLAMLLAEQQYISSGRLNYSTRGIDADLVQSAILARASDADWQVRTRLAECMRWFVLDANAAQVGARLLSDAHWLVRGLAVRMLADQYGAKAKKILERHSSADPDEWVRRLSSALLSRAPATTQPSSTPPPKPPAAVPSPKPPATAPSETRNVPTPAAAPKKSTPLLALPDDVAAPSTAPGK